MNKKNAVENTANTQKEEATVATKKWNILNAIEEVKTDYFREMYIQSAWDHPDALYDWAFVSDQDDICVIRTFKQKVITDRDFRRIVMNFCESGDSKKRCAELKTAFLRGEYLVKKGHIDGRLVIIVQILVD